MSSGRTTRSAGECEVTTLQKRIYDRKKIPHKPNAFMLHYGNSHTVAIAPVRVNKSLMFRFWKDVHIQLYLVPL